MCRVAAPRAGHGHCAQGADVVEDADSVSVELRVIHNPGEGEMVEGARGQCPTFRN